MIAYFTKEIQDMVIKDHFNGIAIGQLAQKYNCNSSRISKIFIRKGIKTIPQVYKRKYDLNEGYFESINTPEKAYFLGFLYSDGYNSGFGFKIKLQERDKQILDDLTKIIGSNRPLFYVKTKPDIEHGYYNVQNQYMLSVDSVKISKDLTKWGCVKNKSFTIKFPDFLPNNLLSHFIRGLYDGDGHFSYRKRKDRPNAYQSRFGIIGSENFVLKMKDVLEKRFGCHFIVSKSKTKGIKTISLEAKTFLLNFMSWLYKDATVFLQRKYDKYQEFLNLYKSTAAGQKMLAEIGA